MIEFKISNLVKKPIILISLFSQLLIGFASFDDQEFLIALITTISSTYTVFLLFNGLTTEKLLTKKAFYFVFTGLILIIFFVTSFNFYEKNERLKSNLEFNQLMDRIEQSKTLDDPNRPPISSNRYLDYLFEEKTKTNQNQNLQEAQ